MLNKDEIEHLRDSAEVGSTKINTMTLNKLLDIAERFLDVEDLVDEATSRLERGESHEDIFDDIYNLVMKNWLPH